MVEDTCLACGGSALRPVVDLGTVPVQVGALFRDRTTAQAALRGHLDLAVCPACGHVQNTAFDPDLIAYDVDYDNSLHHSGTFRRYTDELVEHVVNTYDVRGTHVVEIGSGQGDFLRSITEAGHNTATGYDPSSPTSAEIPSVTMVGSYVTADTPVAPYRLLVCRHVLEHLDDPVALLRAVRATAPPDAVYYFEVPSAEFNFGPDGLWDCIYPHVSYFSAQSFARLVRRAGFAILDSGRSFHDQFLWVEARVDSASTRKVGPPESPYEHVALVDDFAGRRSSAVRRWRDELDATGRDSVALWGAGSKGVNFLTAVDSAGTMAVVDVNPRKDGSYLPGTGHAVSPPESLRGQPISRVLITNPAYRDEITHHVRDLGLDADVVAVDMTADVAVEEVVA